jgi:hypothetical protein
VSRLRRSYVARHELLRLPNGWRSMLRHYKETEGFADDATALALC